MAVRNDNTLWTSGLNNFGQLGLGIIPNTNILTQVGTNNTWFLISAGYVHSQALEFSSTLWSAGRGLEGQLAVGTNTNSNNIVMVNCPSTTLATNELANEKFKATLYPNPTNGIVNIDYNLVDSSNVFIRLTNIQGQIINEIKIDEVSGFQTQNIDLSNQMSGIYFITIASESGSSTSKVFKN